MSQDYYDHTVQNYAEQVELLQARLRRMADQLGGEARPTTLNLHTGEIDYVNAAAAAVNGVHWGLANLHLDKLVSAAGDVSAARFKMATGS